MDDYLRRLLAYNNWSNEGLVSFLARLPEDVLDRTAFGVYGTIRETLNHLFEAEDNYFRSLTRQPRSDFSGRPSRRTTAELAGYARASAANLDTLVGALPAHLERLQFNDGLRSAATALTQLFMHGVEHRTQVATILGANGIEPPDLDAWAHGILMGEDDWPPNWGNAPARRPRFPFET